MHDRVGSSQNYRLPERLQLEGGEKLGGSAFALAIQTTREGGSPNESLHYNLESGDLGTHPAPNATVSTRKKQHDNVQKKQKQLKQRVQRGGGTILNTSDR